nr:hypothetical protein RNT25_04604 [arsenite-oxidising bacterium NT-25]
MGDFVSRSLGSTTKVLHRREGASENEEKMPVEQNALAGALVLDGMAGDLCNHPQVNGAPTVVGDTSESFWVLSPNHTVSPGLVR